MKYKNMINNHKIDQFGPEGLNKQEIWCDKCNDIVEHFKTKNTWNCSQCGSRTEI